MIILATTQAMKALVFVQVVQSVEKKFSLFDIMGVVSGLIPPLGPPWYKHGCFDQSSSTSSVRSSLAVSYSINDAVFQEGKELIVGIVKTTYVDYQKTHTEITL